MGPRPRVRSDRSRIDAGGARRGGWRSARRETAFDRRATRGETHRTPEMRGQKGWASATARHLGSAERSGRDSARSKRWCSIKPLVKRSWRSAEFLGEPDEKSFGPTDVAEPIHVLVLDHLADELRAVLAEPGERIVDVVHGEHDA